MSRSLWSFTSLRNTIIITMLVVRLSSTAESTNVINVTRHSSVCLCLVCKRSRTKLKPPLASTISTMVMAPMRKNRISQVSPRCESRMCSLTHWDTSAAATFTPRKLWMKHVEHPASNTHQQGGGRLVDLQNALKGYAEIADDKQSNDKCNHVVFSILVLVIISLEESPRGCRRVIFQ